MQTPNDTAPSGKPGYTPPSVVVLGSVGSLTAGTFKPGQAEVVFTFGDGTVIRGSS